MHEHVFVFRHSARYPDEVEDGDRRWLAGLLEGEGSFMRGPPSAPRSPVLRVAMVDEDVIDRAGAMLGAKTLRLKERDARWKATFTVSIKGPVAAEWMRALRPQMGRRRKRQIDAALASYVPSSIRLDRAEIWRALDLLEAGRPVASVADQLGVTPWCIYDLRLGRTHRKLAADWRAARSDVAVEKRPAAR